MAEDLESRYTWRSGRPPHGEPLDWRRLFEGYESTLDRLGCAFYAEILEAHPEARYESVTNTVYGSPKTLYASPAFSLMKSFCPASGAARA